MGDELMNIILKRINEQLSHEFIPRDMCLTTLMMSWLFNNFRTLNPVGDFRRVCLEFF